MPRKSVTAYVGGKGPRQRIWEAIRAMGDQEWTRYQIVRAAKVEGSTVVTYLQALAKAGIIAVTQQIAVSGAARENRYQLVNDEGLDAPRLRRDGSRVTQGLSQEQMWRTLRMMSADTNARELSAHASTPQIAVLEITADDYLRALHTAGYLDRTAEGKGTGNGGIQARYRLKRSRNTGPRPPMICRTKVVYDPNEDKVVYTPPVTDEDAIYGQ